MSTTTTTPRFTDEYMKRLWRTARFFPDESTSDEEYNAHCKKYHVSFLNFIEEYDGEMFTEEMLRVFDTFGVSREELRFVFWPKVQLDDDEPLGETYPFKGLSWFEMQELPTLILFWDSKSGRWCFAPLCVPKTMDESVFFYPEQLFASPKEANRIWREMWCEWELLGL